MADPLRARVVRLEARVGAAAHDHPAFHREVRRLLAAVPGEEDREALLLRLESGAASPAERELVPCVEVLRLIVDLQRSV